jgi:DNA ligase-1
VDYERYETICKAGTGFSDEILERLYNELQNSKIKAPLEEYLVKDFKADVWFSPNMVWEIRGADI